MNKIITFKRFATTKKLKLNTYQLEVICVNCRRRGKLWFEKDYKITAHSCPNCYGKTLRTPIWLNARKMNYSFINKFFK